MQGAGQVVRWLARGHGGGAWDVWRGFSVEWVAAVVGTGRKEWVVGMGRVGRGSEGDPALLYPALPDPIILQAARRRGWDPA